MRTAAAMTADHAAKLLGVPRTNVANMESGRSGISAERVRTLADNYGCTDTEYVDGLAAMVGNRTKGWWKEYRDTLRPGFLDIAELEWHAKRLRSYQTVHIPGLLQLGDYARSIFGAVLPALPESEIDLRVAHRLRRQQVLDREQPAPTDCVAYVHEWALRMQFGGRRVMRAQLLHLCEASERDNVDVRVLPVEAGAFPGAGHAVLYTEGPVPQLDTVHLDSAHGGEFAHTEAQLAKYRVHMEWWDSNTRNPQASRDLIHAIAHEL